MVILLISGKQGSGKSTLAQRLENHIMGDQLSPSMFQKLRFAQPLYEMHDEIRKILKQYNYGNYDYSKKDGPLLQMLGTEWGRKIDDNIWVQLLTNRLIDLEENTIVSVEDCRFENEFDAFNSYPKVLRVRLECDRYLRKQRCSMWRENDNHPSETGLDNYVEQNKFDLVIHTDQHNDDETFQLVLNKLKELTNV